MDTPVPARPTDTTVDVFFDGDKHCSFDWNGWGIGVETDPPPGESIAAWRSNVQAIVDEL